MVPKKDFLAFLETFCRPIKGNVFIQYFQLYFSKKRVCNIDTSCCDDLLSRNV